MKMANSRRAAYGLVLVALAAHTSNAQLSFTDFTWTSGVNNNWNVDGNWDMAGFPSAGIHTASVSSASDLTVNLGESDITVAALTLNGTTAGTEINLSGTGHLILQNNDDNEFFDPDGGIETGEIAPVLTYVGRNDGRVLITSDGVAGTTNVISAPVRLNNSGFLEGVDFVGDSSITLSGGLDIIGDEETDGGQLRSFLPIDSKVVLSGPISLTDPIAAVPRSLAINSYETTDHGIVDDGEFPDDLRTPPRGTVEISGVISGTGGLVLGYTWDPHSEQEGHDPAPPPGLPLSTIILSGNNTFTGDVALSRANVAVRHDNALGNPGESVVRQVGNAGSSREVGYNLVVDGGDRTIGNTIALTQWVTFKGDASLEWTGTVYQDAARGLINLLSDGETLTFSGLVYPNRQAENPPEPGRFLTLDGTGTTRITGGIHNYLPDPDGEVTTEFSGNLRKRGTGAVTIDFDESNAGDAPTDYSGYTTIEGGNLHFGNNDDLPDSGIDEFLSSGGAVGIDDLEQGVVSNSTFLSLFNNSSTPNHGSADQGYFTVPYFRTFGVTTPLVVTYDSGGLMLASDEYGENLNFNAGPLSNAANMTLAAREEGSTYTGTITPSTTVKTNPNTYQLGGGAGTLTLPSNNQLTDANKLLVTNGGEIRLEGTNNYTGATRIVAKFHTSFQENALIDTADPDEDGDYDETDTQILIGSTLTVTQFADGASGLGNSALSDPANLMIQGSTLRYAGATGVSSSRLFTIGTAGATIDSSGDGPLTLSSTSALGIDVAEGRSGVVTSDTPGTGAPRDLIFGRSSASTQFTFSTEDLVPGMRIASVPSTSVNFQSGLKILNILAADVIQVGGVEGWTGWSGTSVDTSPITFGPAPARYLTLSGDNVGDNILAPLVGDAADIGSATVDETAAGYGTVGIIKQGAGKWILSNNNTYTGETRVEEGTLLVDGMQTGDGPTTVSDDARFGGTGQIGGSLTMLEGSIYTAAFAGGTIDPLNVLSDVDLSTLGNVLNITGVGTGTSWTLLTYAGTLTGAFESTPGYSVDYGTGSNSLITITKTAGLVGDYNNDGTVNAADYTVWRDNLGGNGATLGANRDPSNSGLVSVDDYNSWKANFGMTAGSGSLAGASVPEPTSLVLMGSVLGGLAVVRRRN